MRSLLDHQADGIEYTLHSHGISASVVGGNISPRLIQFHIKLEAGVKFSRVAALAEELALALSVSHCRITRDVYYIKIEVPRPDPVAVRLFPLMRNLPGELPENAPVLGLDESGVPLLLRLSSPDIAHILICGATGSGKTVLTRSIIASLALQNPPDRLRLLLIDVKGRGYHHFNGLPNLVCPVVTDPLDGLHRLKWAVRHMEKREEQGIDSPALVIVIDEMADLTAVSGGQLQEVLARLLEGGHETGIHLIASTQKLLPNQVSLARNNWPTRIVGHTTSDEAKLASGLAGSGAEKLMGRGDFLLFAKGEAARLQVAHISPAEMEQTVVHLGGVPGELETPRHQIPKQMQSQPEQRSLRGKNATEQEEEYYEQPRKKANQRQFQQSTATTYQEHDPHSQVVSERLTHYQNTIQQRRQQKEEENYPYYNPARTQRETQQAKRQPRQADKWEEEEIPEQRPLHNQPPPQPNPTNRSEGVSSNTIRNNARNIACSK